MNILIANDDGLDSAGLMAIAKAFKSMGKVTVVAPDSQRSCTSHTMTIRGKVRIEKVNNYIEDVDAYKCWGSAVDCVRFGIRVLMKEKPDLVVTGINLDPNMGSDIIYSATVACAREGLLHNIPSLAVATNPYLTQDFDTTCEYSLDIAKKLLDDPNRLDYFLSLNVPQGDVKGLLICDRYGFRDYNEHYKYETIDGLDYITINETTTTDFFSHDDLRIEANAFEKGYATLCAFRLSQIDESRTEELVNKYELNKNYGAY